jgi:hypothetical protein
MKSGFPFPNAFPKASMGACKRRVQKRISCIKRKRRRRGNSADKVPIQIHIRSYRTKTDTTTKEPNENKRHNRRLAEQRERLLTLVGHERTMETRGKMGK